MIIQKELIDASINSKRAAKEAHDKAMLDSIKSKIDELKKLPQIFTDIIDTFDYVREKDRELGGKMWHVMTHEEGTLGLDLCNAVMTTVAGGGFAIRPDYSRNDCFRNLYVLRIGVFFGPDYKDLYPIERVSDLLEPKDYNSMFRSICLLIEAVPAYRDMVANKLNEFIKQ